jgi:pSer/pThr/pTyr-binding forkhead associated (FHA) protein
MEGSNMTSKTKISNGNTRTKPRRKEKESIVITNGYFSGLKMVLKKKNTLIGKSTNCDICLDHNLVSEEHALIYKLGPACWIEDLNTKHGTFINGKEIHRVQLRNKDKIAIGNFTLEFRR